VPIEIIIALSNPERCAAALQGHNGTRSCCIQIPAALMQTHAVRAASAWRSATQLCLSWLARQMLQSLERL